MRDFYFDDAGWVVRYLVADTRSWLPGREVLISPAALGSPDWEAGILPVKLTKERVKNSPSIDVDRPVSRQREAEMATYFGWPVYWNPMFAPATGDLPFDFDLAPGAPTAAGPEPPPVEPQRDESYDPHLRSVRTVTGYRVQGNDGQIGHVDDFIIDDEKWEIRYLVIDTREWWPSRKVLMLPMYVVGVSWDTLTVRVNAPRDSIASGPSYDPTAPINREHELRLYDYYGRPQGWQPDKDDAEDDASTKSPPDPIEGESAGKKV